MADFLKSQLDYIFFVYGAAFFLLIPLCLFLRQRPNCCRLAWGWLGWFGATHGANEWLDLLALSLDANPLFHLARLGVLIVSFLCLAEFGRASLVTLRGHGPGRWVLAVMVGSGRVGRPGGVGRGQCCDPLWVGIGGRLMGGVGLVFCRQDFAFRGPSAPGRSLGDGALCPGRRPGP